MPNTQIERQIEVQLRRERESSDGAINEAQGRLQQIEARAAAPERRAAALERIGKLKTEKAEGRPPSSAEPDAAERTRPVRLRHAAALASTALAWTAIGLIACLALLLTAPPLVGYRSFTVLTGSMEPTLGVGAVVVDEVISPSEARIGDVLTFVDPENEDRLLTHRLRRMTVHGETAHMVTKGDANDVPERWDIPLGGSLGRVAYQIPKLGYARAWVGGRGPLLAVLAGIVMLATWVLVDIWRPAPQATDDSDKRPTGGQTG